MVNPTHLVCECSDAATASATFEDDAPDSASCRLRTNQSRYSIGKLMKVPPIKMYSTLVKHMTQSNCPYEHKNTNN